LYLITLVAIWHKNISPSTNSTRLDAPFEKKS
jgi:secreted trypsin-like serine protease